MTVVSTPLFLFAGCRWRHLRRQLLHGGIGVSGHWHCESLVDGVLRYSDRMSRDEILALFGLASGGGSAIPLKEDPKRSVFRICFAGRSFILKRYHRLHRWSKVSPDQKSWLGAHRLQNDVACYAWYRRHDLREALILFEDVGDYDLFMPECLQMPTEKLNRLFAQAGKLIAQLHAQGIFHADTKPGNFVFASNQPEPQVRLVDTDDVRRYWILSTTKKARNLAQFLGCTREDGMAVYPEAQLAFCQEYMRQLPTTTNDLQRLMPAVRKAMETLYPKWEKHNLLLRKKLQENMLTGEGLNWQNQQEGKTGSKATRTDS